MELYAYLPKYCILVYQNVVFLFTKNIVLLFTGYNDFNRLVNDFPRLSNDYKNGFDSENEIKSIKEGESIYASKSFKWVFYFLLTGFLILALTKMFNPDSGTTWSSLGVIGSGVLFYGMMIIGQKKRTTNANTRYKKLPV
jgi:hypothetical protein